MYYRSLLSASFAVRMSTDDLSLSVNIHKYNIRLTRCWPSCKCSSAAKALMVQQCSKSNQRAEETTILSYSDDNFKIVDSSAVLQKFNIAVLPQSDSKFEFSKSSGCRQELFDAPFATFRKEKSFLKGFLRILKILQIFQTSCRSCRNRRWPTPSRPWRTCWRRSSSSCTRRTTSSTSSGAGTLSTTKIFRNICSKIGLIRLNKSIQI